MRPNMALAAKQLPFVEGKLCNFLFKFHRLILSSKLKSANGQEKSIDPYHATHLLNSILGSSFRIFKSFSPSSPI